MLRCYSYTITRERINLCLLKLQLLKQSIKIGRCVVNTVVVWLHICTVRAWKCNLILLHHLWLLLATKSTSLTPNSTNRRSCSHLESTLVILMICTVMRRKSLVHVTTCRWVSSYRRWKGLLCLCRQTKDFSDTVDRISSHVNTNTQPTAISAVLLLPVPPFKFSSPQQDLALSIISLTGSSLVYYILNRI